MLPNFVVTSYCTEFQFTLHIYKKTPQISCIFLIYALYLLIFSVFGSPYRDYVGKMRKVHCCCRGVSSGDCYRGMSRHSSVSIDIWSVGILSGPLKGLSSPLNKLSGHHTHTVSFTVTCTVRAATMLFLIFEQRFR